MRKLFFAICFSFYCSTAIAATRGVLDINQAQNQAQALNFEEQQKINEERRNLAKMSKEEMDDYLRERLENVVITSLDNDDGLGGNSSVSIQKSEEALAMEKESQKGFFERIYDNAMSNLKNTSKPREKAPLYTDGKLILPSAAEQALYRQYQNIQDNKPQGPVIETNLPPLNEKVLIPAMEHIPYYFSKIEILPDAFGKFTDTIVVVANNNKVKNGITRAFPKYLLNREGQRQKLSYNLIDVKINGKEIPYKIVNRGNYVFFEPEIDLGLTPGVYQFSFEYTINNIILAYDNFDEFYWNITGNVWNLIIARAGAVIDFPPQTQMLGQIALTGYPGAWNENNVDFVAHPNQKNILAFSAKNPLFIGESVNLIVSVPKGSVNIQSFNGKLLQFISEYGNILFAFLGLLAILGSYLLSWRDFEKNPQKYQKNSTRNPYLMRYVLKNHIDNKNFGIFLLELYRKNIIDIEKNDENIFLVKKTDNYSSLSKNERKAMTYLFANHEAILNVNQNNMFKFKKAMQYILKESKKQATFFKLKLNLPYIAFGLTMLILTQMAISLIESDFSYYFSFFMSIDALLILFISLLFIRFKRKWLNILLKTEAILAIGGTVFFLLAIVNLSSALLILASMIAIFLFANIFSQPDCLLNSALINAQGISKHLKENSDVIALGNEFSRSQATIFALDCEDAYIKAQPHSKLEMVQEIIKFIK